MGEPRSASTTPTSSSRSSTIPSSPPQPPPLPSPPQISLLQPSQKKNRHKNKVVRVFRSVFRSLPIITPSCKFPTVGALEGSHRMTVNVTSGKKVSGTLFGYRKGRVSLSLQENPRCLPSLVVELSIQTNALQKEMALGMVRIALECDKRQEKDKTMLIEEPLWTMYCNGKKTGYGVRREATEEDLHVMELLKPVSMGAGVLPPSLRCDGDGDDGELAYVRSYFEHVVGSKDSETLYMLSPDHGNNTAGPELTIFFVRI